MSSSPGEEILCIYADGNLCIYLPHGSLSSGPSVCPDIPTTFSTVVNSNTATQSVMTPFPPASSSWVTASSISSIAASSKFTSTDSAVASMQSTLGPAPVSDLSSTLSPPTATPITTSSQRKDTISLLVKVLPPVTFVVGILLGILGLWISKCYRRRAQNVSESQAQPDTPVVQQEQVQHSTPESEITSLSPNDSFSTVMSNQHNRTTQWRASVTSPGNSSILAVLSQSGSSTTA
ncbi:hypothetical protein C8R44DRAFT_881917 [Mycena epipterygia]|nr:hypothetical protein C8R44DRAFT_881917 [Mycena epipterygia]